jgi:hypothetical protein
MMQFMNEHNKDMAIRCTYRPDANQEPKKKIWLFHLPSFECLGTPIELSSILHGVVETNTDLLREARAWRRTEMQARRSGEAGKRLGFADFLNIKMSCSGLGAFRHGDFF